VEEKNSVCVEPRRVRTDTVGRTHQARRPEASLLHELGAAQAGCARKDMADAEKAPERHIQ